MKSIAVFCGSSMGNVPSYEQAARSLGQYLAKHKIQIIYGGAKVGLMGCVANGALEHGGSVIGVIPKFLTAKEIVHDHLTELIVVDTMQQRKTKMHELCDGIIALPGGYGTLEELFEVLTWGQLGLHINPIGLLNIEGYFDNLIGMLRNMVKSGFLKQVHQDMLTIDTSIEHLLSQMQCYIAPEKPKWIT